MNRTDAIRIMAVIRAGYPSYYANATSEDTNAAVNLWASMFAGEKTEEVEAAVMAFVASDVKGFPPHIGAVKEQLAKLKARDDGMTEMEAWARVKRALRNGLYGFEKEYSALPETIQRCIGESRMLRDWAAMEEQTVDSVVASNFMRSYTARAKHVREMEKMPDDVKKLFGAVGDMFRLQDAEPNKGQKAETAERLREPEPIPVPDHFLETRRKIAAESKAREAERAKAMVKRIFGGLIGTQRDAQQADAQEAGT